MGGEKGTVMKTFLCQALYCTRVAVFDVTGALKMGTWKISDLKMTDQTTGHENDGSRFQLYKLNSNGVSIMLQVSQIARSRFESMYMHIFNAFSDRSLTEQ